MSQVACRAAGFECGELRALTPIPRGPRGAGPRGRPELTAARVGRRRSASMVSTLRQGQHPRQLSVPRTDIPGPLVRLQLQGNEDGVRPASSRQRRRFYGMSSAPPVRVPCGPAAAGVRRCGVHLDLGTQWPIHPLPDPHPFLCLRLRTQPVDFQIQKVKLSLTVTPDCLFVFKLDDIFSGQSHCL